MLNKIFILIFAHLIGDYVLQDDFQAKFKGSNFFILFVHSSLYTGAISTSLYLLNSYESWKVIVLLITHIVIDYVKANAKNKDKALKSYLYIEQLLHNIINVLLFML